MNRIIKFRAFNKVSEIMYYPEMIDGNYNHYLQVGTEGFWLYNKDGKLICTSECGGVLMQYTGLKDKNGKDIYDGDLLKRTQRIDGNFVDRIFERYEVAYNSGIAGFEYKPIDGKEYKQYTVRPFGGDEIEIIGNIHEVNPAVQDSVTHTMNNDPNTPQQEPVNDVAQTTEQAAEGQTAALESAEQDQAVGADSEEGSVEG